MTCRAGIGPGAARRAAKLGWNWEKRQDVAGSGAGGEGEGATGLRPRGKPAEPNPHLAHFASAVLRRVPSAPRLPRATLLSLFPPTATDVDQTHV